MLAKANLSSERGNHRVGPITSRELTTLSRPVGLILAFLALAMLTPEIQDRFDIGRRQAGPPVGRFKTLFYVVKVIPPQRDGYCQLAIATPDHLYYLAGIQSPVARGCDHLPKVHSFIWGSFDAGRKDLLDLAYTHGNKPEYVTYQISGGRLISRDYWK
jgi:hypothetical protein